MRGIRCIQSSSALWHCGPSPALHIFRIFPSIVVSDSKLPRPTGLCQIRISSEDSDDEDMLIRSDG